MNEEVASPIQYSSNDAIRHNVEQFVAEHTLLLIISGSMQATDLSKSITLKSGDLCFIRKNSLLKSQRYSAQDNEFRSISIALKQDALHSFATEYKYKEVIPTVLIGIQVLNTNSLFANFLSSLVSLEQTFKKEQASALLHIKIKEAILILLMEFPELKNILFDFSVPPKINLKQLMQETYHFNVNMSRFALLSGRSLATFKRDFQQSFNASPSKWLTQKRLEQAYLLINKKGKKASEIYLALGFEDLSHFSFAFKKQYGKPPSQL